MPKGYQNYLTKLGSQIKKLRETKDISQSELARMIDRDRQTVNRLEKGRVNPTVLYLKEISEALGISLKKLFDFD